MEICARNSCCVMMPFLTRAANNLSQPTCAVRCSLMIGELKFVTSAKNERPFFSKNLSVESVNLHFPMKGSYVYATAFCRQIDPSAIRLELVDKISLFLLSNPLMQGNIEREFLLVGLRFDSPAVTLQSQIWNA